MRCRLLFRLVGLGPPGQCELRCVVIVGASVGVTPNSRSLFGETAVLRLPVPQHSVSPSTPQTAMGAIFAPKSVRSHAVRALACSFMALAPLSAQQLTEPTNICDGVLVRLTSSLVIGSTSEMALLNLVNESNYEESKHSAGASYAELFGASYDDFKVKRSQRFAQTNFSQAASASRQEVSTQVPAGAVDAWRQCMLRESTGLFALIESVTDDGGTVNVQWKPAPGLGALTNVTFRITGGTVIAPPSTLAIGSTRVTLARTDRRAPISGGINGDVGNPRGVYSAPIFVPAGPCAAARTIGPRAEDHNAFDPDRVLRIEYIHLRVECDGTGSLSFQAAAMVGLRWDGNTGAPVRLDLLGADGVPLMRIPSAVANAFVRRCADYFDYTEKINLGQGNAVQDAIRAARFVRLSLEKQVGGIPCVPK